MNIDKSVEEVATCIICQDSPVSVDPEFGRHLGLIEPYRIRSCDRCGLRWLSPRPTATGYADLYSYENYFDGSASVEHYPTLAAARRPYFSHRLRRIEKMLPGHDCLALLEIGSATGEFVAEARRRGHTATGIELSPGARAMANKNYGIDLLDTPVDELDKGLRFDVIHMNHVFEHLPYPARTLAECYSRLRPGGLLVLEVPQQIYNDLDRLKRLLRLARTPQFNAYSLHHTYFYTPGTLELILHKSGFSTLKLATSNFARTPVLPFNVINGMLGVFLCLSDAIHRGGNIIEVFAGRTDEA